MMRCVVTALLLWSSASFADLAIVVDPKQYAFPLTNPFEATIATTPKQLQPQNLPEDRYIDQDDYVLTLRPEREFNLPPNFWAVKKLKYRFAKQAHSAPLVFIIAGTGSHYASSSMNFLKRVLYQAGFHVVQLSSPTSYDFMAAASRYATPGYSPEDANDLYNVMKAIKEQNPSVEVSDYHLLGYSLGGLQAAFVSHLDSKQKALNFKKVLMINPPVNVYNAISNLDSLVNARVKGLENSDSFFDAVLARMAEYFKAKGNVQVSEAMLFEFQQSDQKLSDEELAVLIGTVFRFASADIVFTSDLVNRRGQVVPINITIYEGTSLTPFLRQALFCNFECYIREQLLPYWRRRFNGVNLDQLIHDVSLYAIEDYLRNSPQIAAFTNADDLILSPGDLRFLRDTMGSRLVVFPFGGHLGNMNYHVNTDAMVEFFLE
ncbi:MAG: hypothetical protein Q8L72_03865 [Moraxellaceae bacterium]|nr:hypothetical protein [Moraxellaceae bacterium]